MAYLRDWPVQRLGDDLAYDLEVVHDLRLSPVTDSSSLGWFPSRAGCKKRSLTILRSLWSCSLLTWRTTELTAEVLNAPDADDAFLAREEASAPAQRLTAKEAYIPLRITVLYDVLPL
jgi:hypothetical protein